MAANRKLTQLVDTTLKKVEEGLQEFRDLWIKVDETANQNQREKYMNDLKKEIKKLQRFREDIMKWTTNPEVKDKLALGEARRSIEVEMERFKVFERESKTKPFSMMGLAMGGRLDAHEQKKQEKRGLIEDIISELTHQCDAFRIECENLTSKKKKTKEDLSRVDLLKKYSDWHALHISALEQVLRRLENDLIDPDDLDVLIDSLTLYLDQFQEPDYYNDGSLYEQFDLDAEAVDATYYKPVIPLELEEGVDANRNLTSLSSTDTSSQIGLTKTTSTLIREAPMTAAAKARAKKLAAREVEAAANGGPIRPDCPAHTPPRPFRPLMPSIAPPALPTLGNPPVRPAPISPDLIPQREASITPSVAHQSNARDSILPTRLRLVDESWNERPRSNDFVRHARYMPSNAYIHKAGQGLGESVYPHNQELAASSTDIFQKLPIDTLMLVFYYREGTVEQYMASQELKRQGWRFHKKFGQWFRRTSDTAIKTFNQAFEFGSYSFFDLVNESWSMKTRSDLTFEYEFLEDEQLPENSKNPTLVLAVQRPRISQ